MRDDFGMSHALTICETENGIMKALSTVVIILLAAQVSFAKYSCKTDEEKLVVDPSNKRVVLTKDGVPHRLKILNPANHGFQLFGNNKQAFEVEGGYIVGIKDAKNSNRKDLSVFKRGEVVASFSDCKEN